MIKKLVQLLGIFRGGHIIIIICRWPTTRTLAEIRFMDGFRSAWAQVALDLCKGSLFLERLSLLGSLITVEVLTNQHLEMSTCSPPFLRGKGASLL